MGLKSESGSLGQDNSQFWVRISYGTNKYVIDSNHNSTEAPADPQEEQASQTSVKVIAARSKAKAKPQQRELVGTTATIPMHERRWIDIEPSEQTLAAYEVSKKVISLLRHNQTAHREEDGAIQFWRIKFHLRKQDFDTARAGVSGSVVLLLTTCAQFPVGSREVEVVSLRW